MSKAAADYKHFRREKETKEYNRENYKTKIRKHKLSFLYRILLILAAIGVIVALVAVQYKRRVYTRYDIVTSLEREAVGGTIDLPLGSSILTYSKDGAHCTSQKGELLWNRTYEIQDILVATCQDVAAIASYNGRDIYVHNSTKLLGSFTTAMPIRSIAVDAVGNVAVLMDDNLMTYLGVYGFGGNQIYEGGFPMKSSGYPASVDLAPSGEYMIISFLYVDAGILKSHVAFYNLGEVGENAVDRAAGGYYYTDLLVPTVGFMNDDTSYAIGDSRLIIYKGRHKPDSLEEFLNDYGIGKKIRTVVYNESYLGLVCYSPNSESRYQMDVYSAEAKFVGSYYFDMDYTEIFFEGDTFVIYNEAECMIMTLDNIVKFHGEFHKTVRLMIPVSSAYKYLIVTNDSIDTIQLK